MQWNKKMVAKKKVMYLLLREQRKKFKSKLCIQ